MYLLTSSGAAKRGRCSPKFYMSARNSALTRSAARADARGGSRVGGGGRTRCTSAMSCSSRVWLGPAAGQQSPAIPLPSTGRHSPTENLLTTCYLLILLLPLSVANLHTQRSALVEYGTIFRAGGAARVASSLRWPALVRGIVDVHTLTEL